MMRSGFRVALQIPGFGDRAFAVHPGYSPLS
jgi:hypothetical protein